MATRKKKKVSNGSSTSIRNLMDEERGAASDQKDKSARNKFDEFLSVHVSEKLSFCSLRPRHVTCELLGQFTSFLLDDEKLGYSTSMSYLSSIRRQLEDNVGVSIFRDNERWYSRLRRNLESQYVLIAAKNGKRMIERAPLMTPEDLCEIGKLLFEGSTAKSLKDRTLFNTQWLSIGRSSDIGCVAFDDLKWMGDYALLHLTRIKTRQQHSIAVFNSALNWETDIFHSLGCQLVVDPYNPTTNLFDQLPSAGKDEEKVASYINRLLGSLSAQRPTLTSNLKSHSSRRGSAVQASSNPQVNLSDVAHRGRWTLDSMATLFEYISETTSADHKVAKALSGWCDPSAHVYAPRLCDKEPLCQVQQQFSECLFTHYANRIHSAKFIQVLAATLLMYLGDTLRDFPNHTIHHSLVNAYKMSASGGIGEPMDMLKDWGQAIRKDFVIRNSSGLNWGDVVDNLDEEEKLRRYINVHTYSDVLLKQMAMTQSVVADLCSVKAELSHLREIQLEILNLITSQAAAHGPIAPQQESSTTVQLPNSVMQLAYRRWPTNLASLSRVTLAALIYQYVTDDLSTVPIERGNHAQRDAREAFGIASKFISNIPPMPRESSEEDRKQWRSRLAVLASSAQDAVVAHIDGQRPPNPNGKRKRSLTGLVTGILRAWHSINSTRHPTQVSTVSTEISI